MTGSRSPVRCLGSKILVTESELLCHSQAVVPLRMKSVSLMVSGTARRTRWGPSYQTLTVCDPASSEVIELGFALPGSCGIPSEAVSTTVPVSGGTAPGPATAASSCAGVRGGSAGAACATVIADAMPTAATAATAPAGTTHRLRRENFGTAAMSTSLLTGLPASRAGVRPGSRFHCARHRCGIPVREGRYDGKAVTRGGPERAGARSGGRTAAGRGRAPGTAGGGLRRGSGPRRRGRAAPGAGRRLRRAGAGPDAAEDVRVQDLPAAPGRGELGPDPYPVRQGWGV